MQQLIIVSPNIKDYLVKYQFNLNYRYLTKKEYYNLVLPKEDLSLFEESTYPFNYTNALVNLTPFLTPIGKNKIIHSPSSITQSDIIKEVAHPQQVKVFDQETNYLEQVAIVEKIESSLNSKQEVKSFLDQEQEMIYVLNQVTDLINAGESIDDITLVLPASEDYQSQLNLCDYYNYVYTNGNDHVKLASHREFSKLVQTQTVSEGIKKVENQAVKDAAINILNKYNCLSEEKQQAYFPQMALQENVTKRVVNGVLKIEDYQNFKLNKHTFFLGFTKEEVISELKPSPLVEDINKLIGQDYTSKLNDLLSVLKVITNMDHVYFSATNDPAKPVLFDLPTKNIDEVITYSRSLARYLKKQDYPEYQKYNLDITNQNYEVNLKLAPQDKIRLSYSTINNLNLCPYRYYLNSILRLGPFMQASNDANIYGSVIHEILEKAVKSPQAITREELTRLYNEVKTNYHLDFSFYDVGINYYFPYLEEIVNQVGTKKNFTETELSYQFDEQVDFVGKIDLIYKNEDKLEVVDYKHKATLEGNFDKYLNHGINCQNYWYIYLLSKNDWDLSYGVSTYLLKVRSILHEYNQKKLNQVVLKKSTPKNKEPKDIPQIVNRLDENLKRAKEIINEGEFKISPVRLKSKTSCQTCPFAHICHVKPSDIKNIEENDGKSN